jgi:hypothetical protein
MTKYKQKDSFIIHHDTASIFQELTNEQAGELIKHLIFYSNSLNQNPKEPKKPSGFSSVITLLAHSFEKQLERDFWKYQTVCERNENNGKKGGRPQKPDKIKTQKNPKKADSDKDSDSDSDSDKDNDKEKEKDIKDTASGSPSQRDISEIPNSPDTKEFLATQKQDGKQDYILNTSKKEGSSKNGILGEKLLNNSMNTKVERVAQGGAQKEKFELKTKQEVQQFVTNFKAHAIIVNGVPKTAPIFSQNEIDLITEYILRRKESYQSKVKSTPKALTGVLNDILQVREQVPLEIIFKQDEGVYVHCGTKGDKTKPYQTITLEYFKTLIQKTTFNKQDAKPTLRETIDTNRNAIKSIDVSKYF